MKIKEVGAVISRGAGVLLLVIAFEGVLSWTSFEVPTPTPGQGIFETSLHDTYFLLANTPGLWVPSAVQGIAALILILFSRPIGRRLAGGLGDDETKKEN